MTESARIAQERERQERRDRDYMPEPDRPQGHTETLAEGYARYPVNGAALAIARDLRNLGDLLHLVIKWRWDETPCGKATKAYLLARLAEVKELSDDRD